jgi:hypothetical protein
MEVVGTTFIYNIESGEAGYKSFQQKYKEAVLRDLPKELSETVSRAIATSMKDYSTSSEVSGLQQKPSIHFDAISRIVKSPLSLSHYF